MLRKLLIFILIITTLISSIYSTDYANCVTDPGTGVHFITDNVTATGHCFISHAANVTFDCQGHTITGDGGPGDYAFYPVGPNATVKNCIVENFGRGLTFINAPDSTLINFTIRNVAIGLYFSNSQNLFIDEISMENLTGYGISFGGDAANSIINDITMTNTTGCIAAGTSDNVSFSNIIGNDCGGGGFYGIFSSGDDITVINANLSQVSSGIEINGDNIYIENVVVNDSTNGLYLSNAVNATIKDIKVTNSATTGIRINGGKNIQASNIEVGYSQYGFMLTSGSIYMENSSFTDITAYNHSLYGIYWRYINTSTLSNAKSYDNTDGLYIYTNSEYNIFFNMQIVNNTDDGIYCADGKYNIISNSNISNNVVNDIRYSIGCLDNEFYNNYFDSASNFASPASYPQIYNTTIDGDAIGNYWADLTCLASEERGEFAVCTNPENYTIDAGTNQYDFAPLAGTWDPTAGTPSAPAPSVPVSIFPMTNPIGYLAALITIILFMITL